jgi:ADP-ribose diphosphatase
MEVVHWPLADLDSLLLDESFTEARAIAALYMTRAYLENEPT